MEILKKSLLLNEEDYFTTHLSIINPMLPKQLTPKEIQVLGAFMSLKGDIGSEQFMTVLTMIVSFYFMQSSIRASISDLK